MAIIEGTLLKVEELEARNGSNPPWRVSVDGYSMLVDAQLNERLKMQEYPSGSLVKVKTRTHWPSKEGGKSGRPVFWVQTAELV